MVQLGVEDLRARLDRHERIQVLDVRPADERAEWSIPGSVYRDAYRALREGDATALDGLPLDHDAPVVTVCARGRTSVIAMHLLRERGFEAYSLAGGMKAWSLAWNLAEVSAGPATLVQVRRTGKGCLSYLVASGSEAIVVDASVDPDVYLDLARARGWTIRHVLDTHVHADHLSRSRAVAATAGATLRLPEQRRVHYDFKALCDGAELRFGDSTLRVISTPGHTRESACYQVDGRWLLSGDTLFTAGVGRPDLEADAEETRARATLLHASLTRLMALPDELLILPCHSPGPIAFDGRPVAAPLAEVRAAVRLPADPAAFVAHVLARIPATPANHHTIVDLNEAGEPAPGDPTDLEAGANRCAIG